MLFKKWRSFVYYRLNIKLIWFQNTRLYLILFMIPDYFTLFSLNLNSKPTKVSFTYFENKIIILYIQNWLRAI